ncbi:hypothetical protein ACX40Y_00680 [Sphingomonas sp. RS6]
MNERNWWETRWFALAVVLLSAVPLLWPAVPPLTDLPGHIGRYHVAASLADSPFLQRHWHYVWRPIGNLGVDLLVMPLIPLIGVEPAAKLVVALIPPLTVASLIWLSRESGGRVSPALPFAFPLAYAFPFQFGFVNFCLSAALSFAALALWLRLAREGRLVLRAVLFAPIGLLLWLAHCFGWGMFGLFAFAVELVRVRRASSAWGAALVRAGLSCVPLALPLVPMLAGAASGNGDGLGASWEWVAKAAALPTLLRERWGGYDLLSSVLLLLLCWAAVRSRLLRVDPMLGAAAALGGIAWLLLPYRLLGGAYVDIRMAPFVVALLIAGIRMRPGFERLAPVMAACATLFFTIRIATTTIVFVGAGQLQERAVAIAPMVPRGASVLFAVQMGCKGWGDRRLSHIAGLVLARRDIFDNSEWNLHGQQLLQNRRADAGDFAADPSQLIYPQSCVTHQLPFPELIRRFDRAAFDYVWTVDMPARAALAPDVVRVAQHGPSTLYRVVRRSRPD